MIRKISLCGFLLLEAILFYMLEVSAMLGVIPIILAKLLMGTAFLIYLYLASMVMRQKNGIALLTLCLVITFYGTCLLEYLF
jgi:hypothetical protein